MFLTDDEKRILDGKQGALASKCMQFLVAYGEAGPLPSEEETLARARALAEAGGPCPRIYHACGTEDFLLENARATRDFFTGLPGNPFDYTYEEDPGAHTWEFWDEHIQHFLAFLGLNPENDVRN